MSQKRTKTETYRRTIKEKGPLSIKVHPPKKHEGELIKIAKIHVITVAPTTPIYDSIQIMKKEGFRRIPIVNPGTKTLQGIVTATDIVNYLGGGDKFDIIQKKFEGNFFKAIYEPTKSIMTKQVIAIKHLAKISEAISLMKQHNIGGLPIIDDKNSVKGIITERDILRMFKRKLSGVPITDVMSKQVTTIPAETNIFEAERTMIRQGFRRLPIVKENKLLGILTVMDIIRFFGSSEVFKHLKTGTLLQVLQTHAIEIATREVITINSSQDVGEAAELMEKTNIGALPVIENEKIVGIITERDFFKLIT
ncbi:MAG: CBS domain-containing protein [Candidatus Jordarchaeaceae archaeon]